MTELRSLQIIDGVRYGTNHDTSWRNAHEEFLLPMRLSVRALARQMGVPATRITGVIKGQRSITADTAIRLEKALGISAVFWMRLQDSYDLSKALAEVDYSDIKKLDTHAA